MLQKLNSRLHEPAYWRGSSPSSSLEYTHIQLNKLAYFGNGNTTPTGKLKHSISITTLNHCNIYTIRKLQQSSSDTSPFYQNSWNSPRGIIKDTQMIRRNELAEHKPTRRKQNFRTRLNMLFKKASYSWKTHNLSKSLANDNQKLCSFWQRTPPQPTTNYTIILPQKQTALPTSPPLNQTKPLKQWP